MMYLQGKFHWKMMNSSDNTIQSESYYLNPHSDLLLKTAKQYFDKTLLKSCVLKVHILIFCCLSPTTGECIFMYVFVSVFEYYTHVFESQVVKRCLPLTGRVVSRVSVLHDFILALIDIVLCQPVWLWDQSELLVSQVPKVRTTDTCVSLATYSSRSLDSIVLDNNNNSQK